MVQLPWDKPLEFPVRYENEGGQLKIVAGPILRYWGMSGADWKGSAMYVTADEGSNYDNFPAFKVQELEVKAEKVYSAFKHTFWRFRFTVEMGETQTRCTYQLGAEHPPFDFYVPGKDQDMNIMFYSCNGFSLGTQTQYFKASMWDDVMDKHETRPFHVMLGGGDQLYCDNINIALPMFVEWRKHNISRHGFHYRPSQEDRDSLDAFFFCVYLQWYGQGYWKGSVAETNQTTWPTALATVPSINIYDDHDILDGYGSYRDPTMRTPVFEALGESAHKYYMLFQLGVAPIGDPCTTDSSFITINKNGPYIHYPGKSIYARLGKQIAFLGLDCRTERTKYQICSDQTYVAVFNRLEAELTANPEIKHLLVMLGVPIAYPRMVWAEMLMESPLIKPVKFLARKGVILKGFVNPYDGEVELLDDLNDHWCARNHKKERNEFIAKLQRFAQKTSTRITILAGDVHLAGIGRFRTYRKDGVAVPAETDHRLMICPVSSAITNTPPPELLADFMNKRNKYHYLGKQTIEDLVHIFSVDTKAQPRNNNTLLPRRNYCVINSIVDGSGAEEVPGPEFSDLRKDRFGYAQQTGGLKITIQVEEDQSTTDHKTVAYSMNVPPLQRPGSEKVEARPDQAM